MTTITMDGKYQTRDGRPVRVLCVDANRDEWPVIALIACKDGSETDEAFRLDGTWSMKSGVESAIDLIPVPEKRRVKFWVNVYDGGLGAVWTSKKDADIERRSDRLACLEIDREFTVGEGL